MHRPAPRHQDIDVERLRRLCKRLALRGFRPKGTLVYLAVADEETGPRRYLSLVERAAGAVDVPVIGSLNGVTPGGWVNYAEAMEVALGRMDAAGRHPLGPDNPAGLRAHLVQEGRWIQHRIRRFVQDRQRLDTHDVGRLLVALVRIEVRDVAWSEITRADARSHVDLWADVVRRSPHQALPAPASLLAFAAWLSGNGALAWCAVDRAQEADPGYSLAALVAQTLACAMPPSAWEPLTPDMLSLFAG